MDKIQIIILIAILIIISFMLYNSYENFIPVDVLTEYKHYKQNIVFFKKVVDFLEKKDIIYWAIGGTLLGAIRDKGMIPWDDDSDISIPRNQIEIIESNLDELKNIGIGWCPIFFGYKFYDLNGKNIGYEYNYPFVDVFVVVENEDRYIYESEKTRSIWPKEYVLKSELFPLKKYKYEYYNITSMNKPKAFLDRAYKDWKIKAIKTYDHINEKHINKIEFKIEYNRDEKPYLWTYWDNINNTITPPLINICYKTVVKNCEDSFNIIKLNNNNIRQYLPELDDYWDFVKNLKIAHKVDLYRIMLLYKYGGLYIDADTIVLKDPIVIMNNLDKYDYIGFGCTGLKCKNGYGKPSNGIMASRPNSHLLGKILENILIKTKEVGSEISDDTEYKFNYFDLGKKVIWEEIRKLEEYEYYHYDNKFDGTRDKYGSWVTTKKIFSSVPIEYENEDDMIFFTLYNSEINDAIRNMSMFEFSSSNWNICKFIKKGLHIV